MYSTIGCLHYEPEKLIVQVDQELSDFYRSLIPKYFRAHRQKFGAHISTVRNEIPGKPEHWNKYEGELIEFQYDGIIQSGRVYFWLNAWSSRLEEIRLELGLPISSEWTRPPDGYEKHFHITLANIKN